MFPKGDNVRDFLFTYLEDEVFPKRKEFAPVGANSFLYKRTQFIWEATLTELLPLKCTYSP